jgi:hypothetical protein
MTIFQPFRQSPDAADFDRDERSIQGTLKVAASLKALNLDGDKIFARIREDLDRGLIREARANLNFVDEILAASRTA